MAAATRTVIMDEKAVQRAEDYIDNAKNTKGITYARYPKSPSKNCFTAIPTLPLITPAIHRKKIRLTIPSTIPAIMIFCISSA